ncbi:Ig-like domain-containing protein [Herbiconiux sp. VKM Ac-2851]|uniref:Ig-like domain-containing protein n=1 Tax=Herbiconiux sp. VKM Ac-2851 TaxID=2739025 RepID=UPI001566BFEE|nr:hypothetical protein [Herbiconiux sp. VKM Ac-2851]
MSASRSRWERTPSPRRDGAGRARVARTRSALVVASALALAGLAAFGALPGLAASSAAATALPAVATSLAAPATPLSTSATPAAASATPLPATAPGEVVEPTPTPPPSDSVAPSPVPSADPDPAPAPAPPGATPDPGDTVTPTPPPVANGRPSILSPAAGELVTSGVLVQGTATPGASVQLLTGGSSEPLCIVTADGDGDWSCAAPLASSPATTLRAIALLPGADPAETSIDVAVLNAPVVTGGPRGPLTNGVVAGTAFPGATVTATAGDVACTGTADGSGAWVCPLADGITDGDHSVSATQSTAWSGSASSPASDPVAITVDMTVPAAPSLASPSSGATVSLAGQGFTGRGEPAATVSVFADAQVLCETPVGPDGAWSCTAAAAPAGRHRVAVLQQDAAGNVSVQSGPLTLLFQDARATTNPPGTAPGTPGPAGGPAAGTPGAAPSSPGGAAPAPGSPVDPTPGGAAPSAPGTPAAPGTPVAPGTGQTPGTWSDATRFTSALQPALGPATSGLWWVALLAGVLALVLIALPTRLLAGAVGTLRALAPAAAPTGLASTAALTAPASAMPARRAHSHAAHAVAPAPAPAPVPAFAPAPGGATAAVAARLITASDRVLGRNRAAVEYERAPQLTVGPVARGVLVLLASAAAVTLSAPVSGEPAYLRLFLAVAAALALVSAVATVVPSAVARAAFGVASRVHVHPSYLVVSALLALVTRMLDLQPALVFGLVAGLVVAEGARRAERGALATVQVVALLVLGVAAWLVSGALQPGADLVGSSLGSTSTAVVPGDPVLAAAAEFVHVVALASFGSAAVLLVPLGHSLGRRLLDWSPTTWVLLTVPSFAVLAKLFAPRFVERSAANPGSAVLLPVLAGGFAAVSVAVWAWTRFIATADADD